MKRIVTATVLLAAIGGGAALAQGLPPGFGAWQSGWRGDAGAQQAQAMRAPQSATARPSGRAALARNSEFVPAMGNARGAYRGG